jgi:hypothetical protein
MRMARKTKNMKAQQYRAIGDFGRGRFGGRNRLGAAKSFRRAPAAHMF